MNVISEDYVEIGNDISTQSDQIVKGLSSAKFNEICRSCLLLKDEMRSIFNLNYENISFVTIFEACFSIQVKEDDDLPKNVCISCINELVRSYCFLIKCKQSNEYLEQILKNEAEKLQRSKRIIKKKRSYDTEQQNDSNDKIYSEEKAKCNSRTVGPPYYCTICNIKFESYNELKLHKKEAKHPRPRNHICNICQKAFSFSHLQQHMRIHTKEKPFQCKVCSSSFSLNCNLRRHMMRHTGERPHICDYCGKGFIQATTLTEHKRIHTGETPFVCSYCGKSFTQTSRHKLHLRKHQIEKGEFDKVLDNKCEICDRMFASRGVLRTHLLIHGDKKFLCNECGKGFVSNAGLQSHLKVHTGVRPYPCNTCSKAFSQLGSLKSHVLIHTGQKPFTCNLCSKAFTQRNHLKYHMRTHSGERPYTCNYCGKSFSLNGTLTVHIRTHTGETPYICDVCGKGFHDSSSMKKHKKGHVTLDRT